MRRLPSWLRGWRGLLLGWLAGLATAGLIALAVAGWILFTGPYNTAARSPHLRIVAWAVRTVMVNSVHHRAGAVPEALFARADLMSGARDYEMHCLACHGGPGVARARWASALLPTPPFLIDAPYHWTGPELFHLVHGGVKMTGMPAWGEIESPQRIADLVTFIEAMSKMTPAQFAKIRAAARIPPPGTGSPAR